MLTGEVFLSSQAPALTQQGHVRVPTTQEACHVKKNPCQRYACVRREAACGAPPDECLLVSTPHERDVDISHRSQSLFTLLRQVCEVTEKQ